MKPRAPDTRPADGMLATAEPGPPEVPSEAPPEVPLEVPPDPPPAPTTDPRLAAWRKAMGTELWEK